MVAFGKLRRHHERIGLRQKDQRVVDDRILGALKGIVAQAAVAGHVDA